MFTISCFHQMFEVRFENCKFPYITSELWHFWFFHPESWLHVVPFALTSGYKSAKSQHKLLSSANYLTMYQDPILISDDRVGLFVIELFQRLVFHPIRWHKSWSEILIGIQNSKSPHFFSGWVSRNQSQKDFSSVVCFAVTPGICRAVCPQLNFLLFLGGGCLRGGPWWCECSFYSVDVNELVSRWSMPLHGVMDGDVLIIVPTKALTEPQCETLICFRYVIWAAMNDCGVSGRPTEFVYPGDTDLTSDACGFFTVVRMKYLCDNDDVREGRMAFQENIEENMTRIFNQLCEEDLCRVSLYYETIDLVNETVYDPKDYCVHVGIKGLLPFPWQLFGVEQLMHQARLFINKWELRGPKNIERNMRENSYVVLWSSTIAYGSDALCGSCPRPWKEREDKWRVLNE